MVLPLCANRPVFAGSCHPTGYKACNPWGDKGSWNLRPRRISRGRPRIPPDPSSQHRDLRESSRDLRESSRDLHESSRDLRESSRDLRESSSDLRESSRDLRKSSRDLRES